MNINRETEMESKIENIDTMLTNGNEINNGNKDLYSFLKRSLNSIESNDAEANE